MASEIISRCIIIVFGLLYPAYRSYKAIKSRSAPLYVKWMMYWIVFAIFYNVETFSDLLLSWFPMYYEMKAIFVIWLLSPSTQGSQVLYQMYIHPHLLKHEEEIELALQKVKSQSYTTLLSVGAQSVNLALQGAIAGQTKLANELRKSYSFDAADSIQPQMLSAEDEYDGRELDDGNSPCNELRQSQYEKHLSKQAKLNSSPSFQQRAPVINRHVRSSQSSPSGLSQMSRRTIKATESPRAGAKIVSPVQRRPRSLLDRYSTYEPVHTHVSSKDKEPGKNTQSKASTISRPKSCGASLDSNTPQASHTHLVTKPSSVTVGKPVQKPRFSESTLRYRTKKISDIKSHKIESPFVSIF